MTDVEVVKWHFLKVTFLVEQYVECNTFAQEISTGYPLGNNSRLILMKTFVRYELIQTLFEIKLI